MFVLFQTELEIYLFALVQNYQRGKGQYESSTEHGANSG
jgi:hypothetical protein